MVSAITGSERVPLYNPCRLTLYQVVGRRPEMARLWASPETVWFCQADPVSASITVIKKAWKTPLSADQDKRKLSHDTSLTVKLATTGFSSSGSWQAHRHIVTGLEQAHKIKTKYCTYTTFYNPVTLLDLIWTTMYLRLQNTQKAFNQTLNSI